MARGRRRESGERGAALVETAITMPVFFLLIFGIIEFGLAFRDNLTVANTTRDAARAGSVMGDDPTADQFILDVIEASSAAMSPQQLTRIVVFEATGPDTPVPPACLAGPVASLCNVYSGANLAATGAPTFGCGPTSLDRHWCPTTRIVAQDGPPDYLGVFVEASRPMVTGVLGRSLTLRDTFVLRLEPTDV
jgi:hypothetical protein